MDLEYADEDALHDGRGNPLPPAGQAQPSLADTKDVPAGCPLFPGPGNLPFLADADQTVFSPLDILSSLNYGLSTDKPASMQMP
ncbi:hypothetical protein FKM82_031208 [Ascaphus truei]